ncbi:hypothetical protein AB0L88_41430 [Saccharopolyspora shandongensis]|uniref:hypothetical protein n=1 Tax=Saccharopolyspora shandongensis TaxID=418495 RepID=UPI003445A465
MVLDTAPAVDMVKVSTSDLRALAVDLARASGDTVWQSEIIDELFAKLNDVDDLPVSELLLRAGGIRLLNAPTGVGKSVLTRLLAIHLAGEGIPVAIVVGTIHEALTTAERISDEVENARRLTRDIEDDLSALSMPQRYVALVSPRRLEEKASQAAARGAWDRFDRLGYGCSLAALVVDCLPLTAPNEPCTSLRHRALPGNDGPAPASGDSAGKYVDHSLV